MKKEDFKYILPRRMVKKGGRYYVLSRPQFCDGRFVNIRIPVNPRRDNPFAVFATVALVEERGLLALNTPEDLPAFITYLQHRESLSAVDSLVLADMSNGRIACRKNAEQVLKWVESAYGLSTELEDMRKRENERIYSL